MRLKRPAGSKSKEDNRFGCQVAAPGFRWQDNFHTIGDREPESLLLSLVITQPIIRYPVSPWLPSFTCHPKRFLPCPLVNLSTGQLVFQF